MQVANIDTLHTRLDIDGYEQQMGPFLENLIATQLQDEHKEIPGEYNGLRYVTRPDRTHGHWHAFRIWHYPDGDEQAVSFDLRVNEKRSSKASTWSIDLDFGSTICWSSPFADLWEIAMPSLRQMAVDPSALAGDHAVRSRVSRVDITIDTDMFGFNAEDSVKFLTRSRHRGEYTTAEDVLDEETITEVGHTALYHRAAQFTGFSFGRGDLVARVYNKYIEIEQGRSYKVDKSFFKKIRDAHGWDQSTDVWRLEYQIRREALRQFRIPGMTERTYADATVPEAIASVQALLPYLLTKWLTYRIPNKNTNHSQWAIDPRWQQLADDAKKTYGITDRVRLEPQFDRHELSKSLKGYIVSYAVAHQEPSSAVSISELFRLLGQSLGNKSPDEMQYLLDAEIAHKAATHGIVTHHHPSGGQLS